MLQFDRIVLGRQAQKFGFVRDTFEKVRRLLGVLAFINNDALLVESLALKGGTAINLVFFDLPRLSVDIDLDYCKHETMESMMKERRNISERIKKYMVAEGYYLSNKSKQYHALDSFIFEYSNAGGMKDNLKVEINYMLRCHVLPIEKSCVIPPWDERPMEIQTVNPLEIFAAKTIALLNRTAARDLFDIYNLQKLNYIEEDQKDLLKKCTVFYAAIASEKVPDHFSFEEIDKVTYRDIKTELLPVLRKGESFDLASAQSEVKKYLEGVLVLEQNDFEFWDSFSSRTYRPELLFSDMTIIERISEHPMAFWKCRLQEGK